MSTTVHSLSAPDQPPDWAEELSRKYRTSEASHFLLYHNIYDLTRSRQGYCSLIGFLQHELLGNKQTVLYNRSEGITFDSDKSLRAFIAQQRVADPLFDVKMATQLPRDPARALP